MKVFVDTAAVMEKPLAAAAGLGWQGKHTNLVSREFGSWLFLGAIFTTLELPADGPRATAAAPAAPASTSARLRHFRRRTSWMPGAAFPISPSSKGSDPARTARQDRQPDLWLRRLSRGMPLEQIRASRAVKPSSRRARNCARPACRARAPGRCAISRAVSEDLDQAYRPRPFHPQCADCHRQFRRRRVGREAERLLDDASPLVRGAAVWALSRLLPREKFAALSRRPS